MSANVPDPIKIYHIVHISKLSAIIANGYLFSDAEIKKHPQIGETIGMSAIKRRRLEEITLFSHPRLHVGECVPFYFCPRSVMLYMLYRANHPDIEYRGGQEPIVHLVSDLRKTVNWADKNQLRWAFTDSNAGSYYFEDYADLHDLDKIHWQAVQETQWNDPHIKEKKQAEFLIEHHFPWKLVEAIGVYSYKQLLKVKGILGAQSAAPLIKVQPKWYY